MKNIFKLPYGNLTNKIIRLEAKSSREICDYYIDISNIIDNKDRILSILASPNQKSVKIINTKVIDNFTFIATILGGDNRTIAGVTFLITTEKGEKRSFNCSIPILSNPLDADCNKLFHMGQPGRAGTIKIKDIIIDDSIDEIVFYNVGTDVDAEYIIKFPSNFNNSGSLETSSKILVSDNDPTDMTFPPSDYENFTLFSKKTNTIWQTELESENYVWKNKGEFGGNSNSLNLDLEFLQPKSLPYGSSPTIETDEDGKILFGIPDGKPGDTYTFKVGNIKSVSYDEPPSVEYNFDEKNKVITVDYSLQSGKSGLDGGYTEEDKKSVDSIISTFNVNKKDVILKNINKSYTRESSHSTCFFTYKDQSLWKNKNIIQIGISVANEGTLSVFTIKNENTENSEVILLDIINLKKDVYWYDLNVNLDEDMHLAFSDTTDTGSFYYSNTNETSGIFYYYNKTTNVWAISSSDLNIGIKIEDNIVGALSYLSDKNVSFIGDSITTFSGYNPSGYATKYPENDVTSVINTWWYDLISSTGATLLDNNSFSGSRVSSGGNGSLQTRLDKIDSNTDLCLIFMGTNDLGNGVAFGDFDPTKTTFDTSEFTDALCNAIVTLVTNYPTTKFVWMTPLKRFVSATNNTQYSNNSQSVDTYTNRIIEVCQYYGIEYIDMREIGVISVNQNKYLYDGLHPNSAGMVLIKDFIFRKLTGGLYISKEQTSGSGDVTDGSVDLNVKSINTSATIATEAYPYANIGNVVDTSNLARSFLLPNRPIEHVMHKGGVTLIVENTVFNARNSYNADPNISFEFDIQSTATDGKFIIWHDNRTQTMLDKDIEVQTSTYDDLRALRFKGLAGTPYADMPMSSLEDWCEFLAQVNRPFYPEIKRYQTLDQVTQMVNIVKSYGLSKLATWENGSLDVLKHVRSIDPDVGVGYLDFYPDGQNLDIAIKAMQEMGNGCLIWQIDRLANKETVQKILDAGVRVCGWTASNNLTYLKARNIGLTTITCDYTPSFQF